MNTSLALAFVLVSAAACGGDDADCGTGGAPSSGLVGTGTGVSLTFGSLSGGLNNDCPASDAPSGVTSLTIQGTQAGGTGVVTLCISRPDLLARSSLPIGLDMSGARAQLIDLEGTSNNCTLAIDSHTAATGTVSSSGLCDNGADTSGFALVVDATMSLTQTCGAAMQSIPITLKGRVAVAAQAAH